MALLLPFLRDTVLVMQSYLATFASDLKRSFLDLATIIGVILAFQFFVIRSVPADWPMLLLGLVIVGVGLALFMRGLEVGIFPVGEGLARHFATSKSRWWLIAFAFAVGFATTIAEPALIAVAHKAAAISNGSIDATMLRIVTAISVGVGIVIGVLRILWNHSVHWYIIGGYALVLAVTYFAPLQIVGLAYDLGGVTTSTVTVPLVAALGIGLASSLRKRNAVIDGFGLIAFASLTPMIFVQIYGIAAFANPGVVQSAFDATVSFAAIPLAALAFLSDPAVSHFAKQFVTTLGDLAPIAALILFFHYVVLRKKIENLTERALGFLMVVGGLYAFVVGLEIGLFPIGETMAIQLATGESLAMVYLFAFAIGFATTIAEPSLTALAQKAEEVSGGAIHALVLRLLVSGGVGLGLLLGAYRIVHGDSLVLYIMVGYAVLVVLTYFAPRTAVPIAYDAGGVTTSTVAVPIIAALGLGLATTIPGRDPLIDGWGLIAFSSLFPMVTVLLYGIGEQQNIKSHERYIQSLEEGVKEHARDPHTKQHTEREARLKKRIVTISGTPGSGATSVAKRVAEILRYRYFSSGNVFREIAKERGITLDELNRNAEEEKHLDHEIDLIIRILGEESRHVVINSRLGYHWIHSSFKVHLTAPWDIAAKRTYKEIRHGGKSGEEADSIREARRAIEKRSAQERERYQELYGVDITNLRPYDLVIDTGDKDIETVAKMIAASFNDWIGTKA